MFDNYTKLNSQYNWGDLYDQLMGTSIFTLTMNEIIDISSRNYEESGCNNLKLDSLTILYQVFVSYSTIIELVRKK